MLSYSKTPLNYKMTYSTYILFSESLQRYYVGSTSLTVEERLDYHLHKHKGFTAKASDWVAIWSMSFETVSESRTLERKIKKRGAKRFLEDLS